MQRTAASNKNINTTSSQFPSSSSITTTPSTGRVKPIIATRDRSASSSLSSSSSSQRHVPVNETQSLSYDSKSHEKCNEFVRHNDNDSHNIDDKQQRHTDHLDDDTPVASQMKSTSKAVAPSHPQSSVRNMLEDTAQSSKQKQQPQQQQQQQRLRRPGNIQNERNSSFTTQSSTSTFTPSKRKHEAIQSEAHYAAPLPLHHHDNDGRNRSDGDNDKNNNDNDNRQPLDGLQERTGTSTSSNDHGNLLSYGASSIYRLQPPSIKQRINNTPEEQRQPEHHHHHHHHHYYYEASSSKSKSKSEVESSAEELVQENDKNHDEPIVRMLVSYIQQRHLRPEVLNTRT
jgi:hypothetical protein